MDDKTRGRATAREWLGGLRATLRLPLVAAPMFLVSGPDLVLAACRAGIMGSFPFPNARTLDTLESWLVRIANELQADRAAGRTSAPWAANVVTHSSYDRLGAELELVARYRPPVVITALGGPAPAIPVVRGYGGLVFADVSSLSYARKAASVGVDGLILVTAGAGGHTGSLSPFAFVGAVREFFDGIIVLSGGIGTGAAIRAAEVLGADFANMGTAFIAARESLASDAYREMVVASTLEDLVLTKAFTGANAYYMKQSILDAGLDPDSLVGKTKMDWKDSQHQLKAWKDIWSAGQSVSTVHAVESVADIVSRLEAEYREACEIPAFGAQR